MTSHTACSVNFLGFLKTLGFSTGFPSSSTSGSTDSSAGASGSGSSSPSFSSLGITDPQSSDGPGSHLTNSSCAWPTVVITVMTGLCSTTMHVCLRNPPFGISPLGMYRTLTFLRSPGFNVPRLGVNAKTSGGFSGSPSRLIRAGGFFTDQSHATLLSL